MKQRLMITGSRSIGKAPVQYNGRALSEGEVLAVTMFREIRVGEYIEAALRRWRVPATDIEEFISGHAKGVDLFGEKWSKKNNVPVKLYKPDWKAYGNSAGHRRNAQMIERATLVVAVWDGFSKGTEGAIRLAKEKKLPLLVCHWVTGSLTEYGPYPNLLLTLGYKGGFTQ